MASFMAISDELFECVGPFCGVGTLRVKKQSPEVLL